MSRPSTSHDAATLGAGAPGARIAVVLFFGLSIGLCSSSAHASTAEPGVSSEAEAGPERDS